MPRVKRGTKRRARRKKILERASGYYLTKSKLYRSAKESVERGLKFAYSGRKQKKRQFRSIWIVRIGAAAKLNGISYSVVHQWVEEGRHRTGSQDPGRSGGQRSRRVYGAVQTGAKRHGIAARILGELALKWAAGWPPVVFRIHHGDTERTEKLNFIGDLCWQVQRAGALYDVAAVLPLRLCGVRAASAKWLEKSPALRDGDNDSPAWTPSFGAECWVHTI